MKKYTLLFVCVIAAMNIYAQSTVTRNGHTYRSLRAGNKTYLRSDGILINKASKDIFDTQYKDKNAGIDPQRIYDAMGNLRITNSNAELLALVKTVFTPSELSGLKNEVLSLTFRIYKDGKIIDISFLGTDKPGLSGIDLVEYSLLEDKLMSTLIFKIPDPGIFVYTITIPIRFGNVLSNGYVFPEKMYLNK